MYMLLWQEFFCDGRYSRVENLVWICCSNFGVRIVVVYGYICSLLNVFYFCVDRVEFLEYF